MWISLNPEIKISKFLWTYKKAYLQNMVSFSSVMHMERIVYILLNIFFIIFIDGIDPVLS